MNMAAILWKFELFNVALIWLQIRNLRPRISGIGLFWTSLLIFDPYLLLAKIRRNLQVCSFNGLSVCLSVCYTMQVAVFDQSSSNFIHHM